MVKSPILNYLRKWFDQSYTSYSDEWLTAALDSFAGRAQNLFFSDLSLLYPHEARCGELNSNVVMLIETDAVMEAIFYYRLARSLYLREPGHPSLRYFANLMRTKAAIEIYYSADIGPRLDIGHGAGLVIGPGHVIGSDFTVYGGVTLGQRRPRSPRETITVGNGCKICTGALVLGAVRLGNNVTVAAGSVLLTDAESNSTYAGVPAVKVKSARNDTTQSSS